MHESGIDQIEKLTSFIDESVTLAGVTSPCLGTAVGIGLVVHLGKALPAAELVLPLDHDAGHV